MEKNVKQMRFPFFKISFTVSIIITIVLVALACQEHTPEERAIEQNQMTNDSLISRGKYLVTIMDCNICHSPKTMGPNGPVIDSSRMLSGYPADMPIANFQGETLKSYALFNQTFTSAAGPWGMSFSANLTPDETGLGNWTEQQFFTAIRQGKYKGQPNGRNLLPPMPWESFRLATDQDLKAIFTYLKSIPPVANVVPPPISPEDLQKRAQ